jgi:uncharacterized protein (DUF1501 family)
MMEISRRKFLAGSGLLGAGLATMPIFGNPFVRRALADIGNRYLVVVFLDGGNDGLNTVTPIDDGGGTLRQDYDAQRTSIGIDPADLLLLGNDPLSGAALGLNPGLAGFAQLHAAGRLALIQNCGYPDPNLSHEKATQIWQTASPLGVSSGEGWLGRGLELHGYGSAEIPVVATGDRIPGEFVQRSTGVLTMRELEDFGFPADEEVAGDESARRAAFATLYASAASAGPEVLRYLGATGTATLGATASYPPLHDAYAISRPDFLEAWDALGGEVAPQLREIAKVIHGVNSGAPGVASRFFHATQFGFDTHANQGRAVAGGWHYDRMHELGDALTLFYDDLEDMGLADDVLVLVWSEFGRRVRQNANGTDHGTTGPLFLLGGDINGGIYDPHANLSETALDWGGNPPYSQDAANPFRARDFRDVYGTILKHWVGLDEAALLAGVLPPDPASLDPNLYWTPGNHNFDLPVLASA